MRAPCAAAAARTAAKSAVRPSADCTAEKATSAVSGPTDSASRSRGTNRVLRSPRIVKGVMTEEKSPSGKRISDPAGIDWAIMPQCTATELPTATRSGATSTSRA